MFRPSLGPCIGALGLLASTTSLAATVTITTLNAETLQPQSQFNVGDEIVVDFVASGYPGYSKATGAGGIVGASLKVVFDSNLHVFGPPVSYNADPCNPTCATKYGFDQYPGSQLTPVYNFTTFKSGDVGNSLLESGTPSGTTVGLWRMRLVADAEGGAAITVAEDVGHGLCLVPWQGNCLTGTVINPATIWVGPLSPPIATDDSLVAASGASTPLDVLANDRYVYGLDNVSVSVQAGPLHGTAVVSGSPGTSGTVRVRYTSQGGFTGTDTFSYTVTTPYGSSTAIATVLVVNVQAGDDTATTSVSTPVAIAIAQNDVGLLDPVQVGTSRAPLHGTVQYTGSPGPKVNVRATYTPFNGYAGQDNFQYSIADGTTVAIGTVTVTVTPRANNDVASTDVNQGVTIAVLANDLGFPDPVTVGIVAGAGHGALTVNGSPGPAAGLNVGYLPDAGYTGPDSFVYSATSSTGTANATVVLKVMPVARNDTADTAPGMLTSIDVLANDLGFVDPVSVSLSGILPAKGHAQVTGSPGPQAGVRILYTANPTASGTDSFGYRVTDGNNSTVGAVVSVRILPDPLGDADHDGVLNSVDNCWLVANPDQADADGDGYGNACDGDLDNNGVVTATDFALLRSVLGQAATAGPLAAAADLDGDGVVTSTDAAILRRQLGLPPGPSGIPPPH